MTSCEQYQELISRMLDDDLSKAERDELAAHVRTCPDCAAVYVAFRSLSENLGADLEEVPASVHENIMAEVRRDGLRAKNSVHRSHRRWHTALTIAACLVLVVAASLSLPKIVGRKLALDINTASSSMAVADVPMAPEAAGEAKNDIRDALDTETDKAARQNDASLIEAMPAEEPAAEETVESSFRGEEAILLDAEQSDALRAALSGESISLDGEPVRELHVILREDSELRPLTILICGEEAAYVRFDGDSCCRIDLSAGDLLALLGLSE